MGESFLSDFLHAAVARERPVHPRFRPLVVDLPLPEFDLLPEHGHRPPVRLSDEYFLLSERGPEHLRPCEHPEDGPRAGDNPQAPKCELARRLRDRRKRGPFLDSLSPEPLKLESINPDLCTRRPYMAVRGCGGVF